MRKILLRNGTLIDGSGAAPAGGSVLIAGDRIAEALSEGEEEKEKEYLGRANLIGSRSND